jgi:hypothetical protein
MSLRLHAEPDTLSFSLPDNPSTQCFSALSTSNKLMVIELGLDLAKNGRVSFQRWSNKEWNKQIKSLEERNHEEKQALMAELSAVRAELNGHIDGANARTTAIIKLVLLKNNSA